jgi:hypothetical protein
LASQAFPGLTIFAEDFADEEGMWETWQLSIYLVYAERYGIEDWEFLPHYHGSS